MSQEHDEDIAKAPLYLTCEKCGVRSPLVEHDQTLGVLEFLEKCTSFIAAHGKCAQER